MRTHKTDIFFLEKILPHRVKTHVEQVFRQVTQGFQNPLFGFAQLESDGLSQQHTESPADLHRF